MKKLLIIDPVGRTRGMERWHVNFSNIANKVFDIKIFGNYNSSLVEKCFTYDKQTKFLSILSIICFNLRASNKLADKAVLAHYGESFNTLLFLPVLLKYPRGKRYMLIHDAVSTLKDERKGIRKHLSSIADKFLFSFFDQLIVHNSNISQLFPNKKVYFIPLPPTVSSADAKSQSSTNKYIFWGFIKRSKNVEFIIGLAKLMPNKTFDIYGTFINDEYRSSFLELLTKEKPSNLNFFETFVDEAKIGKMLCQYDAVLMPYTFITNSGILQTNADYCTISVTSDLPAFRVCSDISVNLELELSTWKKYLESLNEEVIYKNKLKILASNSKRVNEFIEKLNLLS